MKHILPCGDHYRLVDSKDIAYITACQNYTKIYLMDKTMVLCNMSLTAMIESLESTFIQTHKSYAVNLLALEKCYKNGTLFLVNDIQVPISRRKYQDIIIKWKELYSDVIEDKAKLTVHHRD